VDGEQVGDALGDHREALISVDDELVAPDASSTRLT
jgi:hypothetical protein